MTITLCLILFLAAVGLTKPVPLVLSWSDRGYGSDGPWQAVEVEIGTPRQRIALYPGSSKTTTILTKDMCDSSMVSAICFAERAGVFDTKASVTLWDNFTLYGISDNHIDAWPDGAIPYNSSPVFGMDTVSLSPNIAIPNTSLALVHESIQTYPGGSIYPTEVGILSLGSPNMTEVRMITPSGSAPTTVQLMSITGWLYERVGDDRIPSYSYGMHIGSASHNIPGSLVLGGYDQNRVCGEVSSQTLKSESALSIVLIDIGIGTASGLPAWNYTRPDDLLALEPEFSEDPSGINVTIDAGNPYLYLPQGSCDAIASQLPVTYQREYGLYFWNPEDDRYHDIMNSTAYLSFTFMKNMLADANITVKVPFVLLDLTLDQPLIDTPTKYFPCMPSSKYHGLGRAFLQAAFIGVNWGTGSGTGNWFLAQAPGPNIPSNTAIVNIEPENFEIEGSTSHWEDSWGISWTQIPQGNKTASSVSSASPSPFNSSTVSGLSSGAKAGVGLGSGIAGLTISGLLFFFYHGYILSMFHRVIRRVYKMIPRKTMRRASSMINTAEATRKRVSAELEQQERFLNAPRETQGQISAEGSSIGDRGES